jgi:hypothetical protein
LFLLLKGQNAAGIEFSPGIASCKTGLFTPEHLNRIYDPDIIVLRFSASSLKYDSIDKLEDRYEIDIKLIISENETPYVQKIISSNKESKIIQATPISRCMCCTHITQDLSDECFEEIVYSQIIQMFGEGNEILK